jgi:hypothetical protein
MQGPFCGGTNIWQPRTEEFMDAFHDDTETEALTVRAKTLILTEPFHLPQNNDNNYR